MGLGMAGCMAQHVAVGFSSGYFVGDDADILRPRSAITLEVPYVIPLASLKVGSVKGVVWLMPGLQFERVSFQDPLVFTSSATHTTVALDDTVGRTYTRGLFGTGSSLHTIRLLFPIRALFPLGKKMQWSVGLGVEPRLLLGGKFRRAYHEDGEKVVVRDRLQHGVRTYHVNGADVQLSASIKYRDLELFGRYSLVPIFRADEGPDVRLATAGVLVYFGVPRL